MRNLVKTFQQKNIENSYSNFNSRDEIKIDESFSNVAINSVNSNIDNNLKQTNALQPNCALNLNNSIVDTGFSFMRKENSLINSPSVFTKSKNTATENDIRKAMKLWISRPGDRARNEQAKIARRQKKAQEAEERRLARLARVQNNQN